MYMFETGGKPCYWRIQVDTFITDCAVKYDTIEQNIDISLVSTLEIRDSVWTGVPYPTGIEIRHHSRNWRILLFKDIPTWPGCEILILVETIAIENSSKFDMSTYAVKYETFWRFNTFKHVSTRSNTFKHVLTRSNTF